MAKSDIWRMTDTLRLALMLCLLTAAREGQASFSVVDGRSPHASSNEVGSIDRQFKPTVGAIALSAGANGRQAARRAARQGLIPKRKFRRRYILFFGNMNEAAEVDRLLGIMKRAAAAGYNGIVLGSNGGQYIDLWHAPAPSGYARNFARLRNAARTLGLALIPYAISPNEVGYADASILEAFPCHDTEFDVRAGVASVPMSPAPLIENGGFERYHDNAPDGWGCDKPGVTTFMDTLVKRSGNASVRIQDTSVGDPQYGHGRLWCDVSVTRFHAYEFSVWIKTENCTDPHAMSFYFEGDDGQQPLVYANRDAGVGDNVASTQDWKRYTVHFNSLTNTKLSLYFGIWSARATGKAWFDDVALREIGLSHTVLRASLPVTVASFDGAQTYREGSDYIVKEEGLTIPPGSHIAADTRLKVSWYQRADTIGPPFASASQPRYFEIERNIARSLNTLFGHPPAFMMTFDEWRIANWDPAGGKITGGEYMARTVRRSSEMLRRIDPNYELYVWSDMFDPNENARSKYFMVNGSLEGSWRGLMPDTVIMTWDGGAKALQYFADRGFHQVIAGYYESVDNVSHWLDDLDSAEAKGAQGIDGFMYTTWENRFDDLERVAAVIKARGRWGNGAVSGIEPSKRTRR